MNPAATAPYFAPTEAIERTIAALKAKPAENRDEARKRFATTDVRWTTILDQALALLPNDGERDVFATLCCWLNPPSVVCGNAALKQISREEIAEECRVMPGWLAQKVGQLSASHLGAGNAGIPRVQYLFTTLHRVIRQAR